MNELSDAENVGRYCARQRVAEDGRITSEEIKEAKRRVIEWEKNHPNAIPPLKKH